MGRVGPRHRAEGQFRTVRSSAYSRYMVMTKMVSNPEKNRENVIKYLSETFIPQISPDSCCGMVEVGKLEDMLHKNIGHKAQISPNWQNDLFGVQRRQPNVLRPRRLLLEMEEVRAMWEGVCENFRMFQEKIVGELQRGDMEAAELLVEQIALQIDEVSLAADFIPLGCPDLELDVTLITGIIKSLRDDEWVPGTPLVGAAEAEAERADAEARARGLKAEGKQLAQLRERQRVLLAERVKNTTEEETKAITDGFEWESKSG